MSDRMWASLSWHREEMMSRVPTPEEEVDPTVLSLFDKQRVLDKLSPATVSTFLQWEKRVELPANEELSQAAYIQQEEEKDNMVKAIKVTTFDGIDLPRDVLGSWDDCKERMIEMFNRLGNFGISPLMNSWVGFKYGYSFLVRFAPGRSLRVRTSRVLVGEFPGLVLSYQYNIQIFYGAVVRHQTIFRAHEEPEGIVDAFREIISREKERDNQRRREESERIEERSLGGLV